MSAPSRPVKPPDEEAARQKVPACDCGCIEKLDAYVAAVRGNYLSAAADLVASYEERRCRVSIAMSAAIALTIVVAVWAVILLIWVRKQ